MSKKDSSIVTVGQIDIDPKKFDKKPDYNALPILATRDFVLFPGVTFPVQLGRESSLVLAKAAEMAKTPVGVVCQRDASIDRPGFDDIYSEGVIADVINIFEVPGAPTTAILRARGKFEKVAQTEVPNPVHNDTLYIIAKAVREKKFPDSDEELKIIASSVKRNITSLMKMNSDIPQEVFVNIENIDDPVLAINISATHAPIPPHVRQSILEEKNVKDRGVALLSELHIQKEKIKIMQEIGERTKAELSEQQRGVFLQQQYNALKKELFGEDGPEADIDRLQEKADGLPLPDDVRAVFDRECAKLGRLAPQSPDYSVLLSYLELIVDLPWGKYDPTNKDIHHAEETLDADHYGLEKVKERVLEQIALLINAPDSHSPIICLVGAPGVGKTSLGQSIATALGRKYRRVALGGLHDESEIRGHRRTYIGAMPGRIIDALRRAGTANPVILLDEIDKVGSDFRGDPSAALLEVLDPEQNNHFHDNYVDVDFDLSKVLFIATANNLSSIPAPLIDRMEVIDLSGYLPEEKIEIAKRHLLPRLLKDSGLKNNELKLDDNTILALIEEYTSESGVRQLEKRIASIVRKVVLAKVAGKKWSKTIKPSQLSELLGPAPFIKEKYEGNDYPGVVNGLAWTAAGGCTLCVETSLSPSKSEKLVITGNLGDVMKESAAIALQLVRANAKDFGINPEKFDTTTVHIHVPEGAVPKDGPSAGITIATSIMSAFSNRKLKDRVAMTGELTLRGKVLPIGGVKEKILAAKRAGITTVLLPKANKKDVADIPAKYLEGLNIIYVSDIKEVFKEAVES